MSSINVSTVAAFEAVFYIDPLIISMCCELNLFVSAQLISVFGIVSNVVNIRLFQKQGYQNVVNITLTALAVSDIGALTNLLVYINVYNPFMNAGVTVISQFSIAYVAFYMHEYFIKVSSVITAFAALERCLCVALPLKTKRMLTRKLTVLVIATIYGLLSAYILCTFLPYNLDCVALPGTNRTQLSLVLNHYRDELFPISYYITDLLLPYCVFTSLIASAATIFTKLRSKAKWRQSISSARDGHSKEIKSARLFMVVSFVCILLLLPHCVWFSVVAFVRELNVDGKYSFIDFIALSFTVVLESLNCSISIFIYYKMSSKYRTELKKMFRLTKVYN
ncbi:FMRFamide receptor [Biomphalaria glabrata]|nr:FMRFamide receptor [Biomphalaria glabrata]